MRFAITAALALTAASALDAQIIADLSTATPIAGNWTYASTGDSSEARFIDASANPQLIVRCTHSTRQVTIAKAATAAAPSINVWTSSLTRSVPANYNAAAGQIAFSLTNYDPLLDALSNSRGRMGFSVGTQPALVVPAWPEIARVVEDCRA